MINVVLSPHALTRYVVHVPPEVKIRLRDFMVGENVFDVSSANLGTIDIDVLDSTSANIVSACASTNKVSHIVIDDRLTINDIGVEPVEQDRKDTRRSRPFSKLNLCTTLPLKTPEECGCEVMKNTKGQMPLWNRAGCGEEVHASEEIEKAF